MATLVKYADSDSTKDPESDDDKTGKGKKSGNTKGQHHNPAGHGNGGKRKVDHGLEFVANTNTRDKGQRHKGKPPQRGGKPSPNLDRLSYLLNQPCPKHGTKEEPSTHLWKDCYIMQEFKNSDSFRYDHGSGGSSGPGSHGPVMVEEIPVQASTVIRVDITIKVIRVIKVAIIIRAISSSSSRVTRATQSS